MPLPYDVGEGCALRRRRSPTPPVYDRARAVARYSSTMRELDPELQISRSARGSAAVRPLAEQAGAELLADADLIVPVPLYPSRLWSRRFNQSAMLAHAVGRLTRAFRSIASRLRG